MQQFYFDEQQHTQKIAESTLNECTYFSKFYGKVDVAYWLLFHLI